MCLVKQKSPAWVVVAHSLAALGLVMGVFLLESESQGEQLVAQAKKKPKPKPGTPAEPQVQQAPVPEAAALAKAEKTLKEIYKDDYAKSKAADKLALAAKFYQLGLETKGDAAARFVFFREASELAATSADDSGALLALHALAKEFTVPGVKWQTEALERTWAAALVPAVIRSVGYNALAVVEEAVAGDDYEMAARLLNLAEAAAAKSKNAFLVNAVPARTLEVGVFRKEFDRVQIALAHLEKHPKDPEASLEVGKYYCFIKGNWEKGLPFLTGGTDAKLREIARNDLAAPAAAAEKVAVGDSWWELAEKENGLGKMQLQVRAFHWYTQALSMLTGLDRARAEKRMAQISSQLSRSGLLAGESRSLKGHVNAVRSVALSANGRFVLSGSDDKTMRLWDLIEGKERQFEGHGGAVRAVGFFPNGQWALSCSTDETVRVWSLSTGKELKRIKVPLAEMVTGVFSEDGQLALCGGKRGGLWTIDLNSGKELRSLPPPPTVGHKGAILSLAFSPDRQYSLSGSTDNTFRLWNLATGAEVRLMRAHANQNVNGVAFSFDGRRAISVGDDKTVRLSSVDYGLELLRWTAPSIQNCVAFSPNGRRILTGGSDNIVHLWDAFSGKELHRFEGHTRPVADVVFSSDGRLALSGSVDATVRLWELPK